MFRNIVSMSSEGRAMRAFLYRGEISGKGDGGGGGTEGCTTNKVR